MSRVTLPRTFPRSSEEGQAAPALAGQERETDAGVTAEHGDLGRTRLWPCR